MFFADNAQLILYQLIH